MTPTTEPELAALIRDATGPLLIQGNGTKSSMLRPVQAAATVSTAAMSGITLYAPKELVISAKSGTPLAEIESVLAANNQQMIAEPSHLFGPNQTIGGITATNLSGPRRITGGAIRDHVLGVRAVNGNGEILQFGGRVLKNVTGLDVGKFLTGSFGTLAIMTEITFKVLPVSEAIGTIVVKVPNAYAAVSVMSGGLGSPFSVSGAAYLPLSNSVYLRIEEFESSVAYRTEKLRAQFFEYETEILGTDQSKVIWQRIRDAKDLESGDALIRISVPPSAGPAILHAGEALGLDGILDWGGGLVWLSGYTDEMSFNALCGEVKKAGGVWWLIRAPDSLRTAVPVVPPEPPALARLRARVQHAFDPRGLFNPLKFQAA